MTWKSFRTRKISAIHGRGHAQTTAPSTRKKTASSHCLNLQGCFEGAGIVAPHPNRVIRPPRFLQSSGRMAAVRFERGSVAPLVLFQGDRVSASLFFTVRGMFALSRAEGLDQGIAYRASRKSRRERALSLRDSEKPLTPGDQGFRWGKHGEILRMASVWFLAS